MRNEFCNRSLAECGKAEKSSVVSKFGGELCLVQSLCALSANSGNFHDIGAFASDVAALPRIVTLNDIAIANDRGTLTMDAVAKTFRYLDEEEMAKQRALAKAAKGKK